MAALTYTDIETRVMNTLRLSPSNATEQAKVQALINAVYRDICAKQDWSWLEKRQVIDTVAKYDTGTLDVTQGSPAFTFATNPAGNVVGDAVTILGNVTDAGAVYRVGSSAPSYTFDAGYTGVTSTEAVYRLYRDTLPLNSDVSKLLQVKRYGKVEPIRLIGKNAMAQLKIYDTSEGKPEVVCLTEYATNGDPSTQKLLWVHPYPDKAYRLEVLYKQWQPVELTGTARPLIPDEFIDTLWYGSVARGYSIMLADPERAQQWTSLFNDLLSLMSAQQKEYTRDNPGVQPADDYRRIRRRRRESHTSLGSWFDRLPNQP